MANKEVLIVGAGPVGLTLALLLAQADVPCRIIDKLPQPTDQSRAAGIHARTLELLSMMGVAEDIIQQGNYMRGVSLYADGQHLTRLDYSKVKSLFPFAILLPQAHTEKLLAQHLVRYSVTVERGVELVQFEQSDDQVRATLKSANGDESEVDVAYLVGCDGAHSMIRHQLGFHFSGETLADTWIFGDVDAAWAGAQDEAHIVLQPQGLFFIFPFGHDRYRLGMNYRASGALSDSNPTLEEMQTLANAALMDKMQLQTSHWLTNFRISYRKVSHYNKGRVFLIGDAAHIHSPAGGQGMNTGMQDAVNLGWKLAMVLNHGANPALLPTYFDERSPVAERVLKDTERLTQMMTTQHAWLKQLRNKVLPFVLKQNMLQSKIIATMAEMSVNYRQSTIVAEHWQVPFYESFGKVSVGDRAPDVLLYDLQGNKPRHLLQLFSVKAFTILIFHTDVQANPQLSQVAAQFSQQYNDALHVWEIFPGDPQTHEKALVTNRLMDSAREAYRLYQVKQAAIYIIRPDGYIAYRSQPADAELCQQFLAEKIF